MTVIYCATNDQVLVATRMPKVSCNNQNTVKLHVDFDATWNGYAKSAVFYTSKNPKPYEVIISSDGNCLVPAEVLIEEATLYIGIRGVKTASNEIKSTAPVKYRVLAGTPATVISDPASSVYQQLLEGYSVERARLDNLIKNGGTADDAEIVDARVGTGGETYTTLGGSIRGQINGRMSVRTNGYVYPPKGANIDIALDNNEGNVFVTVYADSLTAITPGSSEYGGIAITSEQILAQLPSNAVLNDDGYLVFTVPSYNALCFESSNQTLVIKSIRTISNSDKVLIYNSWANACGGSFMDFYYRQERLNNENAHEEIIDFIGLQKTLIYIDSDGPVRIDENDGTGVVTITLKNGISYSLCDGDTSTTSAGISKDQIVEQLGETKAVLTDDTLTITLNSYQALCLDLASKTLLFRHLRYIQPTDIVLLYNSWANVQGILMNKALEQRVRNHDEKLGNVDGPINVFNSGDISYDIDTAEKCAEFADLFNDCSDVESFLFFTDPHLMEKGEDYEARLKQYIVTLEKYYKSTPTSFVLCGGDWIGNSDTPTEAKYKLGYIDGFMNGMFDKYYPVLGNHDTNYQGKDADGNTHAGILENQTIANLWYRKYGKNYYAFDGNSTRFYVLDSGTDWDYTLSKYRLSQIEWLGKMLKTEDRAHSAIAVHIFFANSTGDIATFGGEIGLLISAYHNREVRTLNGVTYDFSKCTGRVEFIITGHTHTDMTGFADAKTPVICTSNMRSGDTPTFDLVYADYNNRLVNLVRVGTGSNRVIELAT
jgi:hypothetical protein